MNEPKTETGTVDELTTFINSLSEDTIPEAVANLHPGDAQKQQEANHAYSETRRKAKEALSKANARIKELEEAQKPQVVSAPPQPEGDTASPFVVALTQQAMLNCGLAGKQQLTLGQQHMVQMEMNRIYVDIRSAQQRESDLRNTAPVLVAEKLSKYSQLSDEDRSEVAKRLGTKSLADQVNDAVIRDEVTRFVGERLLSDEAGIDGGQPPVRTVPPVQKNVGSGVKTGRSKQGDSTLPAPVTPQEQEEMRKYGFTDVSAYRDAKLKKESYKGR